jgi:hypothetical protein
MREVSEMSSSVVPAICGRNFIKHVKVGRDRADIVHGSDGCYRDAEKRENSMLFVFRVHHQFLCENIMRKTPAFWNR